MHELVASLRHWGRCLQGPEHRDGQGERHNNGEGDVEVLAHPPGCIGRAEQRQARASVGVFSLSRIRRKIRGLEVPIRARVRTVD